MHLRVFSDGGARGNPGPSAIAFLVVSDDDKILHNNSLFLGDRTNNQAEYCAIIAALQYASSLKAEEVTCYLDSELVAKQLQGHYAVKNPELRKLWEKTQQLRSTLKKVTFKNVSRTNEFIQKADALLNQTLDEETRKSRSKD